MAKHGKDSTAEAPLLSNYPPPKLPGPPSVPPPPMPIAVAKNTTELVSEVPPALRPPPPLEPPPGLGNMPALTPISSSGISPSSGTESPQQPPPPPFDDSAVPPMARLHYLIQHHAPKEKVRELLASDDITPKLLLDKDPVTHNTILHTLVDIDKKAYLALLLESDKCTTKVLSAQNKQGQTAAHLAALNALEGSKLLPLILASDACNDNVLAIKNMQEETVFHIAVKNGADEEVVNILIASDKCNEKTYAAVDAANMTILHHLVSGNQPSLVYQVLSTGYCTDEMLATVRKNGNTAFYDAMLVPMTSMDNQVFGASSKKEKPRLGMTKAFIGTQNCTQNAFAYTEIDDENGRKIHRGFSALENLLIRPEQPIITTDAITRAIATFFIEKAIQNLKFRMLAFSPEQSKHLAKPVIELYQNVQTLNFNKIKPQQLLRIALVLNKTEALIDEPKKHMQAHIMLCEQIRRVNRPWAKALAWALVAVVAAIVFVMALALVSVMAGVGGPIAAAAGGVLAGFMQATAHSLVGMIAVGPLALISFVTCGAASFFSHSYSTTGTVIRHAEKVRQAVAKLDKHEQEHPKPITPKM